MNVYANDYAACVLWVCACVRFTFMCIRSLAKLCWHSIFGVWKVLLSLFISHTEYFSAGITVARTHRFGAGYCFHFVHSDSFIHSILAAGYGPFGIISSPSLSFIHIKYVLHTWIMFMKLLFRCVQFVSNYARLWKPKWERKWEQPLFAGGMLIRTLSRKRGVWIATTQSGHACIAYSGCGGSISGNYEYLPIGIFWLML